MKQRAKLPTILGVLILVVGVISGVFLINSRQIFKIGANVEAIPKNIRVTNISESSVTISWTTDIESTGFVKWGKSEISLSKVALEEGSGNSYVHSANILGLEPNSTIYFKINSNTKDYDNEGIAWQATTLASKINVNGNLLASGTILKSDGATPAKAIIYISINGTQLSALSSDNGSYVIPISNYITNINDSTAIELSVQGGQLGTSQGIIYPKSIKYTPAMILGRTYDFRTATQNESNQLPESTLTIPESVEVSSRFEVSRTNTSDEIDIVKIESIDEGEIITTTDPEFFGSGPSNANIEILVESELQTETLTTTSSGKWSWNPPNNLEPGEHKLTVKWKDGDGILRTLTRSFIVSAAEGPAFESTPSATPITIEPTPTSSATSIATSTPAASEVPSSTALATLQPTPETGSLTPTISLFIMGISILITSLYIWNKVNLN